MYSSVLNCHNVAIHTKLGFNATSTGNAECFKKELYSDSPNVDVWRVLRKRLHLKAYKLSIVRLEQYIVCTSWSVQHFERWILCTALSVNVFVTFATQ
jgi:hypothetical protein